MIGLQDEVITQTLHWLHRWTVNTNSVKFCFLKFTLYYSGWRATMTYQIMSWFISSTMKERNKRHTQTHIQRTVKSCLIWFALNLCCIQRTVKLCLICLESLFVKGVWLGASNITHGGQIFEIFGCSPIFMMPGGHTRQEKSGSEKQQQVSL